MMKMILNGKADELIDVTSFSRTLDVPDPAVRFRLNIVFYGDYSADGFEYLANYANKDITSIYIKNEEETVMLDSSGIIANLESLNESCDGVGRNGYATIVIKESVGAAE